MKNKFFLLILSFVLSISLISCTSNKKDSIKKYLNDIKNLAEYERTVSTTYNSIINDNNIDDYTAYLELQNIILPNSRKLVDSAESIEYDVDELRDVHELYISSVNNEFNAFVIMLSAIENQDYSQVAEANKLLDQSRKDFRNYEAKLKKLCEDNNILLEEELDNLNLKSQLE